MTRGIRATQKDEKGIRRGEGRDDPPMDANGRECELNGGGGLAEWGARLSGPADPPLICVTQGRRNTIRPWPIP